MSAAIAVAPAPHSGATAPAETETTTDCHRPRGRDRYEASDVGAMIGRMLRALARRAAEGDTLALEELRALEVVLDEATVQAARGLHDFGYSWTEVGVAAGVSRQAARQRFAP